MLTLAQPQRCLIRISGQDNRKFLQGMITQDVMQVAADRAIYALQLSPQGKFQEDFFVFQSPQSNPQSTCLYLDIDQERAPALIARYNAYKLRADCQLSLLSDYRCFVRFAALGDEGAQDQAALTCWAQFQDPRCAQMGQRLWLAPNESLVALNANDPRLAAQVYEQLRIKNGLPQAEQDIMRNLDTILDRAMDEAQAIGWNKGCYMGQEITARMKYRALLKRHLIALKVENLAPSAATHAPETLQLDQEKPAQVTSSAGAYCMALISNDVLEKALAGQALRDQNGQEWRVLNRPRNFRQE